MAAESIFDQAGFGVCVLDLRAGAVYQNQRCRDVCGCGKSATCPLIEGGESCRLAHLTKTAAEADLTVIKAQEIGEHFYDLAFIRENGREYRFIFPLDVKL